MDPIPELLRTIRIALANASIIAEQDPTMKDQIVAEVVEQLTRAEANIIRQRRENRVEKAYSTSVVNLFEDFLRRQKTQQKVAESALKREIKMKDDEIARMKTALREIAISVGGVADALEQFTASCAGGKPPRPK
ncbi:uncharacterized protein LOC129584144 [Paramacrobiotus metropolitanus]|uniref:uncharacterized protein LOC129584144 n=1 Tax=Paramacrobiotus metropolitanus TaxID=2943436 RepID=UPI002445C295|nr:uncharacterized protein LOC129584144 [Paramacrobiotus metropolitanus]